MSMGIDKSIYEEDLSSAFYVFRELSLTPVKPREIGHADGLNVVVNTSTADYYYPMASSPGYFTLIFDPMEYADITTGNARMEVIDTNSENFLRVSLTVYEADSEVKNYAVDKVIFVS